MATINQKMQVLGIGHRKLMKLTGLKVKIDLKKAKPNHTDYITINNMLDDMLQPALERKEKYLKTLKK